MLAFPSATFQFVSHTRPDGFGDDAADPFALPAQAAEALLRTGGTSTGAPGALPPTVDALLSAGSMSTDDLPPGRAVVSPAAPPESIVKLRRQGMMVLDAAPLLRSSHSQLSQCFCR
ncbi:hypothetical protein H696_04839 [Fonticula alba]|uniref:Uncharacterized protein n=1 Tax=Fonticula alba TaxID=691883 RepID=A0A058Z4W9_FONAL|nr:hypothetical protein H696_04839 [Fonticula alba]KCV68547.1 hypothetical protein H696_04839 [Fonticula alba]|eukprot:XP_009496979.1 hypothetical protein H696_04839 [Fonticula alba]